MCVPRYSGFVTKDAEIIAPRVEDYQTCFPWPPKKAYFCPVCLTEDQYNAIEDRLVCLNCGRGYAYHAIYPSLGQSPCSHTSVAEYFRVNQDELLPVEFDWVTRKVQIDSPFATVAPSYVWHDSVNWIHDLLESEGALRDVSGWLSHSESRVANRIRNFGKERVPDVDALLGLMKYWWVEKEVRETAKTMLPSTVRVGQRLPTGRLVDMPLHIEVPEGMDDKLAWDAFRCNWQQYQPSIELARQCGRKIESNCFDPATGKTHLALVVPFAEMETKVEFGDLEKAFRANVPEVWRN